MVIVSPLDAKPGYFSDVGQKDTLSWGRRMVDPGDYLPLIGVLMLAGTTVISIAGAYALGRSRRRDLPSRAHRSRARRANGARRASDGSDGDRGRADRRRPAICRQSDERQKPRVGFRQISFSGTSDHAPLAADVARSAGRRLPKLKAVSLGIRRPAEFPVPSSITLSETQRRPRAAVPASRRGF